MFSILEKVVRTVIIHTVLYIVSCTVDLLVAHQWCLNAVADQSRPNKKFYFIDFRAII